MKNLIVLLCMTVAGQIFAQVKMQGVVKDSIGTPLELANVIAINTETNSLDAYAITNDKGKYILKQKCQVQNSSKLYRYENRRRSYFYRRG